MRSFHILVNFQPIFKWFSLLILDFHQLSCDTSCIMMSVLFLIAIASKLIPIPLQVQGMSDVARVMISSKSCSFYYVVGKSQAKIAFTCNVCQGRLKAYIPLRHKTIYVWSLCWLRPPTPQFCVGYTNMLVSKNAKTCATPNTKHKICVTPNAKHKMCVTPNAKPQRKPMKYRLSWVSNARLLCLSCTFHVACAYFIRVGYPTRTQFAVEYGFNSYLETLF